MAKNIVVFSDGTGQEGGKGNNTNVYKLFNMVEDRTGEQISFYDRGLGTDWRRLTGNAFGMGISQNVQECYRFIFENYCAGDRIYLFGFSRGATTVRSLSGLLHLFGILPKSRPELIKKAYAIYKKKHRETREALAADFVRRHHTMWCRVKFLGVWDTVAALGFPFKSVRSFIDKVPWFHHRFHDLQLSATVEHARHALAIDDQRKTFHPKLWEEMPATCQTMKQVWFCGMHSDVGGGYAESQLSDIALTWMVREAQTHGLRIYQEHKVTPDPDPNGMMHDSRSGRIGRLFRKQMRSWDYEKRGNPTVHQSVEQRTKNENNVASAPYKPWILQREYDVEY